MAHSYTRFIVILAASVALSSCAPYIGSCTWVVPEGDKALRVVNARKPIAGECNCINCDAPGRFVLERDSYTLEFWNGDRWYGQLYLRARGKDGAILTLSSDSPELLRMAPHVPESASHGFEYFMRVEPADKKHMEAPLKFSVLQADGRVLGSESIRLRVETRRDVQVEYL